MQHLDLTLSQPAENLALDEALLDAAESGDGPDEIVRLWESPKPAVVVGRSSRLSLEVNLDECQRQGVPVLRRSSGGATIVAGPGCLMYAVVLSYTRRPHLRPLDQAHGFVLGQLAEAIGKRLPGVRRAGTSDLVLVDDAAAADDQQGNCVGNVTARKFSGNSLRCKRTHMLYHGTLLYDFPLRSIGAYLLSPPRQPDYRDRRTHAKFVSNVPLDRAALASAVLDAFDAHEATEAWPEQRVTELVTTCYGRDQWTTQFE